MNRNVSNPWIYVRKFHGYYNLLNILKFNYYEFRKLFLRNKYREKQRTNTIFRMTIRFMSNDNSKGITKILSIFHLKEASR